MRLEAIELTNFLSHASTTWEPNGARLAAIVGANGAGKSALLDGALYALFDAARAKTDQLVRLGETDMSASIRFSMNGGSYRVVRGRTTKGAGKSYLELAIAAGDGTWTTMTGDDIRASQAAIEALLGLDATTFTTAAFLRQGEADAFITATAGERKRILTTVLGLDVYERAEARARERARDVEARTAAARERLERIRDALTELGDVDDRLAAVQAELTGVEAERATQRQAQHDVEKRIRRLEVLLAAVDALDAQVATLRAERASIADDWRAAHERAQRATQAIAAAERVLGAAGDIEAAAAALTAAQETLVGLMATEKADRDARTEIETKRRSIDAASRAYAEAAAGHRARYEAARRRVDELTVAANALEPVICEACGHHNVVDQAGIRDALHAAQAEFRSLEGAEPKTPVGLAREQAMLARLESRRLELGFAPELLVAAHAEVNRLTSIAARGEVLIAARATLEAERANAAAAAADELRITERGQAITAQLVDIDGQRTAAEPLRVDRKAREAELATVGDVLRQLEDAARALERRVAATEANVARRDELVAERDGLEASIAGDDLLAARLRRLVGAFGVTGIPARIIEGVLPELASYANDLLAELRPGMRLELRAQRAKRDGKGTVEALDLIVRDDVGERALGVFSGGEKTSVSLAIAVGLSRLVARRAGARISTFVVDEPDGLDIESRRAFGQALRILAHRGELERIVLVTHNQDLADVADAVYQVTKNDRGSVVSQVA